jgi:hypothetical protein
MAILDPNEINNTVFEPILSHRFRMMIDGVATYMIKAVNGIGFQDGEVIIDHINTYFKIRAKRRFNDLVLALYDPCAPSGAQMVSEWASLAHENVTARSGYADMYWKDATIQVIGPPGDIVREWVIKKAFIKEATFGEYDYSTEVYTTINLTLGCSRQDLSY